MCFLELDNAQKKNESKVNIGLYLIPLFVGSCILLNMGAKNCQENIYIGCQNKIWLLGQGSKAPIQPL